MFLMNSMQNVWIMNAEEKTIITTLRILSFIVHAVLIENKDHELNDNSLFRQH